VALVFALKLANCRSIYPDGQKIWWKIFVQLLRCKNQVYFH